MSKLDKEIGRISVLVAAKLTSRAYDQVVENPSLRFGQALFNLLMQDHPNLATFYTGTGADFYYETNNVVVTSMFYKYWVEGE